MLAELLIVTMVVMFLFRDTIREQYAYYCVRANIDRMRIELDILNRQLKDREAALDAECKRDPAACATATMIKHLATTNAGIGQIQSEISQIRNDLTATAKQYAMGPVNATTEAFLSVINGQLDLLNKRIAAVREDVKSATAAQ